MTLLMRKGQVTATVSAMDRGMTWAVQGSIGIPHSMLTHRRKLRSLMSRSTIPSTSQRAKRMRPRASVRMLDRGRWRMSQWRHNRLAHPPKVRAHSAVHHHSVVSVNSCTTRSAVTRTREELRKQRAV